MYHPRRIELEPPRRVMIIGSPGSDKTTLGKILADRLALPFFELQREYWKPGWVRPEANAWARRVSELAAGDEWVISGTFPSTMDLRVLRADWIVWIDISGIVCLSRKLRQMMGRGPTQSAEVAPGCPRRVDFRLLRFTWTFPTMVAPGIAAMIARERRNRSIFILRSQADREEFLSRVPTLGGLGRHDTTGGSPPES
jgi:adenylate kinase family enzyme